ncbi:uncharacterized protein F5891DRAFT_976525 [Suillus fuscotomentosus]|uniref:Uncharacterized protein n=1 Tax=Suillus fuscotomentosus TaxID=1912939 RepID=A0AAD4EF27_9AGAM|nr:uncharacterized protein F5891DRAFT_976525 [Suillus fuscotomentosus]KAG1904940.1 hypothetical protein F5891DRAFT_976525 [Suillus fuscotomentosus]
MSSEIPQEAQYDLDPSIPHYTKDGFATPHHEKQSVFNLEFLNIFASSTAQSHTCKHQGLKFDLAQFMEAIAEVGVADNFLSVRSGILPTDRLAIHDAFTCRHKVLLSEKKIQEHSFLKRKNLLIPGAWRVFRAQHFQSGDGQSGHQVFWKIYESDGDSTTFLDSIIQNVLSKIDDELVVL